MTENTLTRRAVLAGLMAAALPLPAPAQPPKIVVHRDPSCGCCGAWIAHLRAAGFAVEAMETAALGRVKARLGVPRDLSACHTAEVEGYIVEGHVPAAEIGRLLAQRPNAAGLAVPGMPVGSPGMEVEGHAPESYDVILFGPEGRQVFARYRGGDPV